MQSPVREPYVPGLPFPEQGEKERGVPAVGSAGKVRHHCVYRLDVFTESAQLL